MIYTKTGDLGETSLASGKRVSKTDARIEAYGTVDELNSWIGLLRAGMKHAEFRVQNSEFRCQNSDVRCQNSDEQLQWIQNKLFNLGAALSDAPGQWIKETDVQQLEQWIDGMQAEVPKQRAFILPAGSETVCRCHVCRTVCRRAERRIGTLQNAENDAPKEELKFVNRLSDYLFVLSRYIGHLLQEPEEAWKQG